MSNTEVGTSARDGIVLVLTVLGGLALIGMATGLVDAGVVGLL